MSKNVCPGCKQELCEEMFDIYREDKDWEVFFFCCVACGTKSTICFEDYENLQDDYDWYVADVIIP